MNNPSKRMGMTFARAAIAAISPQPPLHYYSCTICLILLHTAIGPKYIHFRRPNMAKPRYKVGKDEDGGLKLKTCVM